MSVKTYRILGIILGLSSLSLFVLTYLYSNLFYFLLGIILIVLSIFMIVFSMVVDLYNKEKSIDYEVVKKMNLTLVTCKQCGKENILEDQYCKYCHEELEAE